MEIQADRFIDPILFPYKALIGKDYQRYKNHVYRVFLYCSLLDDEPAHTEKYAIAAAFHDIGIWTHHTLDYLGPSIEQAKTYLQEAGKSAWIVEISLMIDLHHKLSRYKGEYEMTVETFRKADWIDVSLGVLHFGLVRRAIQAIKKSYKNKGFHQFLLRSTIKALFRHPFKNPLPIFKV